MDLGTYNLVKIVGSPVHFAFKHKVLVFAKPVDSTISDETLKYALKDVFSGRSDGFITNAGLQSLYESDAHFIAYDKNVSESIFGYQFSPKSAPQELTVELSSNTEPKKGNLPRDNAFLSVYNSLGQEFSSPEKQIETLFKGVFNTLKSDAILK
jgi:hypothetical protein